MNIQLITNLLYVWQLTLTDIRPAKLKKRDENNKEKGKKKISNDLAWKSFINTCSQITHAITSILKEIIRISTCSKQDFFIRNKSEKNT